MNWTITESKFKYNGKPVVRRKAICNTPLGEFKVYEAVGGNIFYTIPEIRDSHDIGKYISDVRTKCESFEKGIAACEAKWEQIKLSVNNI